MKWKQWLLIVALLLALSLAACGGAADMVEEAGEEVVAEEVSASEPEEEAVEDAAAVSDTEGGEDTIVWARYGDSDTLDPQKATSTLSLQSWKMIYDSLLNFDMEGNLQPGLAKEWETSEDGTEVTFYLQEGVKCHDGVEFTAEDVVFTAERAIDPATGNPTRSAWGPIESVEATDDYTVKFTFETPFGPFPRLMADAFASIICESGVETYGDDQLGNNPVGTGPWKFVSWTKGDEIVLERNEDYTNFGRPTSNPGAPYAKSLIIKTIPEPQTRLAAVQTGAVTFAEPPLEEVQAMKENPDFTVHVAGSTGQLQFLEFTTSRPPFDEQWAREAVAHAIDIPMMLEFVFGDLVDFEPCAIAQGNLGNDRPWCDPISPSAQHDPEKAQALLEEHGYGPDNPLEVTLMTYTGGNRDKTLQVLQQQLEKVGFKINIEMMDIGTLNARVKTENNTTEGIGAFDSMGWSWFDPDILYQLFHCPGWVDGYCDPELDVLLEQTRTTVDPVAREQIVKDVQEFLFEHYALIPMYTPAWEWIYVADKDVEGFVYAPFNYPMFADVRLP